MDSTGILLALGHPLVIFLIGIAVLGLWKGDARRPHYLLCFGLSYLSYGFGVTSQITMVPADHALNVMFSGLTYIFAAVSFAQGVISLGGGQYKCRVPLAIAGVAVACRAYFLLVQNDSAMRVYCLHGAIFLLFLHSAYAARGLRKGLLAERVTYYSFVLFTLSTPARIWLTVYRPKHSYGFDFSSYWIATSMAIYAFGMVFGLSLIITIIQRNLRAKRASDENLVLISHDLRAPVATVLGNLNLLQESATPEQAAHMQAIERSTRYQLSLIDDILAGKDDTRPLEVNAALMSLRPFLADLALHGRMWCTQNRSVFSLQVLTILPGHLRTDERRIKQVLLNLLSNAALATHEGNVALHVSGSSDEPGWVRICFEIHDTGPGIDTEQQRQMFEAHRRFDHQRPGFGLGLYIAQRIARNLGGVLEVRSEIGKGSSFSLTLRVRSFDGDALPAGWQPALSLDDAGEAAPGAKTDSAFDHAIQHAHRHHHAPAKELCLQLALYASEGRYSDIRDWADAPTLREPLYSGFRSAVHAALDAMDFDEIQALAQRGIAV